MQYIVEVVQEIHENVARGIGYLHVLAHSVMV